MSLREYADEVMPIMSLIMLMMKVIPTVERGCTVRALLCTLANVSVSTLLSPSGHTVYCNYCNYGTGILQPVYR